MEKNQNQTPDPAVAHIVQDCYRSVTCVKCFKPTGRTTNYLRELNAAAQFACIDCGGVYIYVLASKRALSQPDKSTNVVHDTFRHSRVKPVSYNDTKSLEGFTF